MDIFVDCDGCLVDDRADQAFKAKMAEDGLFEALDWYQDNCPDNLELNVALYLQLVQYKAEGHRIVLWTNRGEGQIDATLRNLSMWGIADMFDAFVFGDGNKTLAQRGEGIYIDNEWTNLDGVQDAILIPTFTV